MEKTLKSSRSFFESVGYMVKENAADVGTKFSANTNYMDAKGQFKARSTVMVQTEQSYSFHYLQLPFSSSFLIGARKLLYVGYDDYFKFLDTFEMHFITFAGYGAKFIKSYTMLEDVCEEMSKKGMSVKVLASYSNAVLSWFWMWKKQKIFHNMFTLR